MAILVADNFKYQGRKPLDNRIVHNTLVDIVAQAESIIHDGIICYSKADKKFYVFDSTNPVDPTTKKWRELTTGGGSVLVQEYFQDTDYKKDTLVYIDSRLARVRQDFKSDNTAGNTRHQSYEADLVSNLVPVTDDETVVAQYKQNIDYKKDMLVYLGNKLALVNNDFKSDNTGSFTVNKSFDADITSGDLILITGEEFKVHLIDNNTLSEKLGDNKTIIIPATVTDAQVGHLAYDYNGVIGKIVSIDYATNSMVIVTISNNGGKIERLKSKIDLNTTVTAQTVLKITDIDTTLTITDLTLSQLIFDEKGTVAKIDSIDNTTGDIKVSTITLVNENFVLNYLKYKKDLKKDVDQMQILKLADIDTILTLADLKENYIVYDLEGTVAKIETIDKTNNEIAVRIITSSASASMREYKTTDTLSLVVDTQQVIAVPAGVNVKQVKLDQLVYDDYGTVARVVAVDETKNELTVQTMTGLGMPTAPDTKSPKILNGGSGYTIGDIIETLDAGFFVDVVNVDANGIILEVTDSTATAQSVTGTGAEIAREQDIYGGYDKNWSKLSDAAVRVATTVAEKFEYGAGYDFSIDDPGTGYTINEVIATGTPNVNVIITNTGASGEILSVSYTRKDVTPTSGTTAQISTSQNKNIFVILDKYWNEGISLFTLTNDDGAWVQFLRTDDSLVKYSAGPNGKTYQFVYNPINGTITQSYSEIKAANVAGITFEDNHSYKENDLIMRNNRLYKCTQDYQATNDFDIDLAAGYWEEYQVVENGGEII